MRSRVVFGGIIICLAVMGCSRRDTSYIVRSSSYYYDSGCSNAYAFPIRSKYILERLIVDNITNSAAQQHRPSLTNQTSGTTFVGAISAHMVGITNSAARQHLLSLTNFALSETSFAYVTMSAKVVELRRTKEKWARFAILEKAAPGIGIYVLQADSRHMIFGEFEAQSKTNRTRKKVVSNRKRGQSEN